MDKINLELCLVISYIFCVFSYRSYFCIFLDCEAFLPLSWPRQSFSSHIPSAPQPKWVFSKSIWRILRIKYFLWLFLISISFFIPRQLSPRYSPVFSLRSHLFDSFPNEPFPNRLLNVEIWFLHIGRDVLCAIYYVLCDVCCVQYLIIIISLQLCIGEKLQYLLIAMHSWDQLAVIDWILTPREGSNLPFYFPFLLFHFIHIWFIIDISYFHFLPGGATIFCHFWNKYKIRWRENTAQPKWEILFVECFLYEFLFCLNLKQGRFKTVSGIEGVGFMSRH